MAAVVVVSGGGGCRGQAGREECAQAAQAGAMRTWLWANFEDGVSAILAVAAVVLTIVCFPVILLGWLVNRRRAR